MTSPPMGEALRQAQQALTAIAERAPQYLELSARLANDARLAARHPSLLDGLAMNAALFRFAPGAAALLFAARRLLSVLRVLQTLLHEAQPAVIDEHLAAVGLTRHQVDADIQALTTAIAQLTAIGAERAGQLASEGARLAGRLASKGLRALRSRQPGTSPPDRSPPDTL